MNAAIYIRVSTDEQAKHGYSIAAQKERLEAYCVSQDWTVVKVYNDEGHSAKDTDRPQLQQMLRDIEGGAIDVVLVYRLDRLTRSVLDLYQLLNVFDKYNVKFKSATEVYDTTTATGRLFITLVAALAQWERENLAERVKFGMLKKVAGGEWSGGVEPYGYRREGEQFVAIPEEAKLVQKMYKMARTIGMDSIARKLNQEGYRTRRGAEWAGYTVQYIVKNPMYMGKFRFNDERFQTRLPVEEQQIYDTNLIEPIIEEKEFWDLQAILDKRRERSNKGMTGGYYFTSILRCGKCGSPMQGTTYNYGGKKVKYYRCAAKARGKSCNMPVIKEEKLAEKFIGEFSNIIEMLYSSYSTMEGKEFEVEDIQAELRDIEKKMNKYKMMFVNDIIGIEELNMNTNALREREKELRKQLQKSNDHIDTEYADTLIEDVPKVWGIMSDEERKQLLLSIFKEVVVDADEKSTVGPGKPKPFWIVSVK